MPSMALAAKCEVYHSFAVKCLKEVAISALLQQAMSHLELVVVVPKMRDQLYSQ
jgi:hypothetical protein